MPARSWGCRPLVAPVDRRRQGPSADLLRGGRRSRRSSYRPTTQPATRSSPTTGPTTAASPWRDTYNTGGLGGVLTGSVVDHLASQGSLTYDQRQRAALRRQRRQQHRVGLLGPGRPAHVAPGGELGWGVPGERGGARQPRLRPQRRERRVGPGLCRAFGHLVPLPGSNRALGLDPTATPQFTNTPGQVAFSPDGSQLIVTTKANGNDIDVFGVGFFGLLSPSPVVNSEPGAVPFAVTFDPAGHLVVAEAGSGALATFTLNRGRDGDPIDAVGTGQAATCWVAPAGGFFYASNAGSATVSGVPGWRQRPAHPARDDDAPTREQLTPRPRPTGSSSTSRPVGTGSSTSSRSTPTEPSAEIGSVDRGGRGGWRRHRRLLDGSPTTDGARADRGAVRRVRGSAPPCPVRPHSRPGPRW